ncbi:hypothetical protein PIB30_034147 [Stylosanthes scabra]|uniref:Uncharacterized protein n=1 Tax=Stylosanthes scabra TaxID=79078 RepID=A0ABU6VDH4_9FABA|nr:hypothetical protein [Stylosanthes scabra]
MVNGNVSKNGKGAKRAPAKESKPKKDQCLNKNPEKRALIDKLGFGVFPHLPNYYLKQKVLKEIYNRFDTDDHTIHAVAGEVEITTQKIGKALGLSSIGITSSCHVTPKDLSEEDHNVYKFFQGKTQVALSKMIFNTPVETEDNWKLSRELFCCTSRSASSCPHLLQTSPQELSPRYSIWRTQEAEIGHCMCITSSLRR